jgi:hypothetical protein
VSKNMSNEFKTQQFVPGFVSPFIFRIAPIGFFVGISPFGFVFSQYEQPQMVIRRISETEYTFLRRIGIVEIPVMTDQFAPGNNFDPFDAGK